LGPLGISPGLMLWSRYLLTALACTQLSLVGLHQLRRPAAVAVARPETDGLTRLVNRVAASRYGLLDPLPSTQAEGIPLEQIWKDLPEQDPLPVEVVPVAQANHALAQANHALAQANHALAQAPEWLWLIISDEASRRSLDPVLIESIIRQESGFQADAVSATGAVGLMQLMPETAQALGVADSFDPKQNVAGGSEYLAWQLRDFGGDLSLALAAYNAGPAAVRRWGGVPPYSETTNYVQSVLEDYRHKLQTAPAGL
jgi:soluble lytic murein transglycosylase-like protein